MTNTAMLDVKDQNLPGTFETFFRSVLGQEDISAILVPQKLPMKNVIMPTLVSDPEKLAGVDPLAPFFPMNAAKIVSRLTRKPIGSKVAVVLRPCEIRAFIELVKLKQGNPDELLIIGIDCPGAYSNKDYSKLVDENTSVFTQEFVKKALAGEDLKKDGTDISSACKTCEHPIPTGADVLIGLFGISIESRLMVQALTPKGQLLFENLGLSAVEEPETRKPAVEALIRQRTEARDAMFKATGEAVSDLEKLTTYLAGCINCYNCRVACPVCYCKECVFVTDVFNHEPSQYLRWAQRKGMVKMPTDTVFYHITRLAHMSTACVGCGQCSNACPNDIPVMELFKTTAFDTQNAFNYEAGKRIEDKPPLSEFRENEFTEVVGIQ